MKLHRFIGNFDIGKDDLKVRDEELLNQIRNVLRLEKGGEVILSDGNLNETRAKILEMGKDFIEFEILEKWQNQNEPDKGVILYCAILKKENFELVVQKATEIGVKEIIPLITARTVKLDIRKDRLEKIIKEATEQSSRGIVPVLHNPINFEDAVKNIKKGGNNLLFDSSGSNFGNWKLEIGNYPLGVWVGPEGGWTPEELEMAKKYDFKLVSLGKLTLRAETAAIVGSYLVVNNN